MNRSYVAIAALSLLLPACGGSGGADPLAVPPGPGAFSVGVAYLADADVDETFELYVADLEGDGALKVSGPIVAGGNVRSFRWSPDRSRLAFLADKDTVGTNELYAVGASGGAVVKVSGPLVPGGNVLEFEWSPDSQGLAYSADAAVDEVFELFVGSATGAGAVRVSGTMAPGGQLYVGGTALAFAWAPDASRVAYLADQQTDGVLELFTSLPDGTGNVRASGSLVAGGNVSIDPGNGRPLFAWAPDSSAVAYAADQDADDVRELYRSLPDGLGNVKVSAPLADGHEVENLAWAPDGSRLAYVEGFGSGPLHEGDAHTVLPDGGGHVQVSQPFGPFAATVLALLWSPDASRIAYAGLVPGDFSVSNLFLVNPDGTDHEFTGHRIDMSTSDPLDVQGVLWSPSSERLMFRDTFTEGSRVWTVDAVDPGFGPGMVSEATGRDFAWSPDSSRIAYVDPLPTAELRVAFPDTDWGTDLVSAPLSRGRMITGHGWTPDSSRLLYVADVEALHEFELFAVAPDGSAHVRISGPLVLGGAVTRFEAR